MLNIDQHEPSNAVDIIRPSAPCQREILNERGYADYMWEGLDGRATQVERKTWPEILANVDAVEDQLRRHMKNQPKARLIFILEGLIDVDASGTYTLNKTGSGVWVKGYRSGTRISRVYSWMYNASEYVEMFQTPNYFLTCQMMVQMYNQDQKEESQHKTFNRYFKKVTFHPNPQVLQLIGLMPGLGEVKAEALIGEFVTVWNVLNASPARLMAVKGIGPVLANTLLQRVGRTDV